MNDPVCQLLYQRFAWPHVRIAFRSYRDTAPQDIADELAREARTSGDYRNRARLTPPTDGIARRPSQPEPRIAEQRIGPLRAPAIFKLLSLRPRVPHSLGLIC